MKKNINFILITILLSTLIGSISCKKYEDGGNSFRIKNKLHNKTWELSYVDITSEENYNKPLAFSLKSIYFNENGTFYVNNDNWGEYSIENKESIKISVTNEDYFNTAILLYNGDTTNYTYTSDGYIFELGIKELTNKNLSISMSNIKNSKTNLSYE